MLFSSYIYSYLFIETLIREKGEMQSLNGGCNEGV